MLDSPLIRYMHNEFIKLSKSWQIITLWILLFILPIIIAYILYTIRYINPSVNAVQLIQSKMGLYFFLLQLTILPVSILLFFVSLKLEHRYNTFYWTGTKTIDENLWILAKFLNIFVSYCIILFLSLSVSFFIVSTKLSYSNVSLNFGDDFLQNWFWQLSFHFLLLPLPAFLTMFCVGLLIHHYSISLLLAIVLTYVTQLNNTLFYPFNALRFSINLNEIILRGSAIWKYNDFEKYYSIAGLYSLFLFFIIKILSNKVGIFKLFKKKE